MTQYKCGLCIYRNSICACIFFFLLYLRRFWAATFGQWLCSPQFCSQTVISKLYMVYHLIEMRKILLSFRADCLAIDSSDYDQSHFYIFQELNTTVCAISQKPAQMLCSKGKDCQYKGAIWVSFELHAEKLFVFSGHKQYESTSDNEMPAPLRRVKAPRRKRNRAKVNPEERPPRSTEPPLDSLSPEEWPGNIGKSNRKRSSTKKLYANTTSPSQSVPEKTATLKSKREAHNTNRPSLRSLRSRQTATPSEASPCHNSVSPYLEVSSSDDEFTDRTKKQGKGAHRKRGEKKSPPKCRSSRKQSSKESGTEQKKTSRVTKQKQSKTSPTIKTLSKVTQSSKKHKAHKVIPQKQDEDEWTDAELIKLKQ